MKCADRTGLQRFDTVRMIILGTGRACEVENIVNLPHIERLADIFLHKLEARFFAEVSKISPAAGKQVIDNHHVPALGEQGVCKMRSQKAGAASDESATVAHAFLPCFRTPVGTPSGY